MTPQEIGDLLHDWPPGSQRRREAAREQMRNARAAGTLLEPEPRSVQLPPMPTKGPEIGQWARQRTRCNGRHGRHGPYDEPMAKWHLVKLCKWLERRGACRHGCTLQGACGARLNAYDHGNGHREYLEVATGPPDDACRKCLERIERQRAATERLQELVAR